jgi:hypothetical protein
MAVRPRMDREACPTRQVRYWRHYRVCLASSCSGVHLRNTASRGRAIMWAWTCERTPARPFASLIR